MALAGAAAGAVLLVITWYVVHNVAAVRQADATILGGFIHLHSYRLNRLTHFVANLCDPVPYVLFAPVPVLVALLRGRPRVAVALALVLLGANETTEILKPLLGGARDPVPGLPVLGRSWPSGHATASMSLALCAVIAAPSRLRPLVSALMAAFAVAVCYSFLELGWHYPSDVLGGFLVASSWTLLAVAALWTYEAHRPALARAAQRAPTFTIGEALAPPVTLLAAGLACAAIVTLARPHEVLGYARGHLTFVVGAAAIAALSFALASGLNLLLRSGWGRDRTRAN